MYPIHTTGNIIFILILDSHDKLENELSKVIKIKVDY